MEDAMQPKSGNRKSACTAPKHPRRLIRHWPDRAHKVRVHVSNLPPDLRDGQRTLWKERCGDVVFV